jgi:hypothetical protein
MLLISYTQLIHNCLDLFLLYNMRLVVDYLRLENTVRWYEPRQLLLYLRCGAAMPNNNEMENHFRKVHCFNDKTLQQMLAFASSIRAINNLLKVELLPNNSAPCRSRIT